METIQIRHKTHINACIKTMFAQMEHMDKFQKRTYKS
jgi:hypothetical protein